MIYFDKYKEYEEYSNLYSDEDKPFKRKIFTNNKKCEDCGRSMKNKKEICKDCARKNKYCY